MDLSDQTQSNVGQTSASPQSASMNPQKPQQGITRIQAAKAAFRQAIRQGWRHPIRTRALVSGTLATAVGLAIGAGFVAAKSSTATWNRVYSNGSFVGYVPNRASVVKTMRTLATAYGVKVQFEPVHTAVSDNYPWRSVASLPTPAAVIELNGKPLVYTANEQEAESLLNTVKRVLSPRNLPASADVKFAGNVTVQPAVIGVSQISNSDAAVNLLLHPNRKSLAGRSEDSLLPSKLPGKTSGPASAHSADPLLQVIASETVTKTVKTDYPIHYIKDDHLGTGTIKVLHKGSPGKTRERLSLKYVNGHLTQTKVITKSVITKPVAEVAEKGTNNGIAGPDWSWPVDSYTITSPFGWRILYGAPNFHPGIDIACSVGTPIHATNNGVVVSAGWNSGGYGNWVEMNNGNGIETIYGHMSHVVVHDGETVYKGQLLGYSGDTGFATGPHLHYEVRLDGRPVNPRPYM